MTLEAFLIWTAFGKLVIGAGLLVIVALSVYRFKGLILTVMGLLLLSNLITLAVIAGLTGV